MVVSVREEDSSSRRGNTSQEIVMGGRSNPAARPCRASAGYAAELKKAQEPSNNCTWRQVSGRVSFADLLEGEIY